MNPYRHISVAIPLLDEMENLPSLMSSLSRQSFAGFDIFVCVNNPEGWGESGDPYCLSAYNANQESLRYLRELAQEINSDRDNYKIHVLDCSSPGCGWTGKRKGVGWARRMLFDAIANFHDDDELVVSLDADTAIASNYLETVLSEFNNSQNLSHLSARHIDPQIRALAVPYYHPLSGDEHSDRAMLRYEIYMRHYLISLYDASVCLHTCIPYTFTALGSAMVFPLGGYKKVGGITPLQGGEDFYLLQKFAKAGVVVVDSEAVVRPQGRMSRRVPFGTGPAIAAGLQAMQTKYPLFPFQAFLDVAKTYALFPELYYADIDTPLSGFLRNQLSTDDLWQPLRDNYKTCDHFVHACAERVDGLRILQYLKGQTLRSAEEETKVLCLRHNISFPDSFSFAESPLSVINRLRNDIYSLERSLRKEMITLPH
ncbi:MAG: hypothetical protein J6Y98_05855 [Bacteroidales bacterium]|nr:hypothetical protein [Bacteroidales bacterium]